MNILLLLLRLTMVVSTMPLSFLKASLKYSYSHASTFSTVSLAGFAPKFARVCLIYFFVVVYLAEVIDCRHRLTFVADALPLPLFLGGCFGPSSGGCCREHIGPSPCGCFVVEVTLIFFGGCFVAGVAECLSLSHSEWMLCHCGFVF